MCPLNHLPASGAAFLCLEITSGLCDLRWECRMSSRIYTLGPWGLYCGKEIVGRNGYCKAREVIKKPVLFLCQTLPTKSSSLNIHFSAILRNGGKKIPSHSVLGTNEMLECHKSALCFR